jgi:hypothetical protein
MGADGFIRVSSVSIRGQFLQSAQLINFPHRRKNLRQSAPIPSLAAILSEEIE